MDIEISLSGPERDFVDAQIRSGRAVSEGDVLREALRCLMQRDVDERRGYEAWRRDARRRIELGHQQCLDGETVDGAAVLERIRLGLARRGSGS